MNTHSAASAASRIPPPSEAARVMRCRLLAADEWEGRGWFAAFYPGRGRGRWLLVEAGTDNGVLRYRMTHVAASDGLRAVAVILLHRLADRLTPFGLASPTMALAGFMAKARAARLRRWLRNARVSSLLSMDGGPLARKREDER